METCLQNLNFVQLFILQVQAHTPEIDRRKTVLMLYSMEWRIITLNTYHLKPTALMIDPPKAGPT